MKPTIPTIEVDKDLEDRVRKAMQWTRLDVFLNFPSQVALHPRVAYWILHTKSGQNYGSRSYYG